MTARTALEIYLNPDDLELYIGEEQDKKDIWGLVITRGPRPEHHPFNVLLTSNEISNFSKERALQVIKKELDEVKKFGDEFWTHPDYKILKSLSGLDKFNTKDEYIKEIGPIFENSDIEMIMTELKNDRGENKHTSSTYKWKIWDKRYPKKEQKV